MDDDFNYHMARSAAELQYAEELPGQAGDVHRRLAELHQARAGTHRFIERIASGSVRTRNIPIFKADKEA